MPVPLDEYPIHQLPISFAQVGTTDRHFYDRCISQCFRPDGDLLLITGLGVYPNLAVVDGFAAVRTGDRQVVVRASDALAALRTLRAVCDGDGDGVGFDLTWTAAFPGIDEPHHVHRPGGRTLLDAQRFVQMGSWSGVVRVEGTEHRVDDWVGTRDRSWGIRPGGEPVPPGRPPEEENGGFWHTWVPLRFDDFGLFVFSEEDGDGHRIISQAVRVWEDGSYEELGWPEIDVRYRPGTRLPVGATIHLSRRGKPIDCEIDVEGRPFVALAVGAGYGGDPEWSHGMWKGRGWVEGAAYDLTAPDIAGRLGFSVNDHVARATFDGAEGWGIFEHASFGRHDPSGFTDFASVAP
jgi:hypothetical protein